MKITRIEVLHSKEPTILPIPWRAAWRGPKATPITSFEFSFYKVYTDEGLVGYGPNTGYADLGGLIGADPCYVEAFFDQHMSGRRSGNSGRGGAGIEIAMWDILGKAAGLPIHKLLGAMTDRVLVYAATSRLMEPEETAEHIEHIAELGFRAAKLRLHRPDPWDDVEVVEAVRDVVDDDFMILVDANQNNVGEGYTFWSRRTAQRIAQALDDLDVYYLEEPLPRQDIEGLADIAASVDMFIAGGEHTPTVYDFCEHLQRGAYDIIQPDVILGGNYGITGVRRAAILADYYGRLIVPHVMSGAHFPLGIAASLHVMASVENCPVLEFGFDPPILTAETTQKVLKTPFMVEEDGCVPVPQGAGLGVELDEEQLEVVTSFEG
ncbi:MAG: mandelate racemase/muconate lactonizing enzyme family protein [Chloroflexi bacterium]|nr:mandelate racemase/muconate lactonizing enzyme family protein [Chloroflexota bacterium]